MMLLKLKERLLGLVITLEINCCLGDLPDWRRLIRKARKMWLRENRRTIWQSLATSVRIKNRAQLVRHIAGRLRKSCIVTDDMIYVTHYGYDDRIDWDEYIVVVDGCGVFGYTDEPCPYAIEQAQPTKTTDTEIMAALSRQMTDPRARTSTAAKNASLRRVARATAKSAPGAAVAAKRAV